MTMPTATPASGSHQCLAIVFQWRRRSTSRSSSRSGRSGFVDIDARLYLAKTRSHAENPRVGDEVETPPVGHDTRVRAAPEGPEQLPVLRFERVGPPLEAREVDD